jgi:hypothetical protein
MSKQVRIEREKSRTCDSCGKTTMVFRLTMGGILGTTVRACWDCWESVEVCRAKIQNLNLDSAETTT